MYITDPTEGFILPIDVHILYTETIIIMDTITDHTEAETITDLIAGSPTIIEGIEVPKPEP